jgi:hypothetical protein
MKFPLMYPAGPDVVAVRVEGSTFVTVWDSGRESPPTNTIEQAVERRQRARAVAAHSMLERKRRRWPTPRI